MVLSAGDPATQAASSDQPVRTEPDVEVVGPVMAPALARATIAVVFCGFGTVAVLYVLQDGKGPGGVLLAVACLLALLALQYFYFCRPGAEVRAPEAYAALAVQAGLAYLPVLVLGQGWVSQPSFLAGSLLLVLRPRVAWAAFAFVVVSTGVAQYFVTGLPYDIVYILINTATSGLFVYGLTRLARLVTALHAARDELATRTVADERARFARDLHGLLGAGLSAIAPRGELTLRLLRHSPEQAGNELLEILRIARRLLADVRSTARLYSENVLADGTASLITMLAASNVVLRVDLDSRDLPEAARNGIVTVLREGVSAVLSHHEVTHCEIVLRHRAESVSVDILTDGGGADRFGALSATVAAMSGELTTRAEPDGRLRLHVTIPVRARPAVRRSDATDIVTEDAAADATDGAADGAADGSGESVPLIATKLASGIVLAVLSGSFLQAEMRLIEVAPGFGALASGTVCLLAVLVLQLAYFSRPGRTLRSPVSHLLLGLQAVFVYLPWLLVDQVWTGLPGFLAGSALLVLRPAWGWAALAAVLASVGWFHLTDTGPRQDVFSVIITLDVALITYGLTWMVRSVHQLITVRQELAQAALAAARLQFARDVHDLLGLSLSAISLKCHLAHRLIAQDPHKAGVVLAEMVEISRRALGDARSVTTGQLELSLAEECRTAQHLLTAAGMQVQLVLDDVELPPAVDTVLAAVLREGVTNVLRHSGGRRCEITIDVHEHRAHLHVVNDGMAQPAADEPPGSGIRNMSARIAAFGGELTAGPEGADLFGLRASVPL